RGGQTRLSKSAVCQAKLRLPLALLARLHQCLLRQLDRDRDLRRSQWRGHRVLGGDGVHYYTPDTPPLRKRLGSKKRFGYPLLKVLTLFDLGSGAMLHQIPLPHRRQEAPLLGRLLRRLKLGDVLILDRAFASFWNLLQAQRAGVHLLVRLKRCFWAKAPGARPGTRRTSVKRLGPGDILVRWQRPKERTPTLSLRRWLNLPREG